MNVPKECAVKVFKTTLNEFKTRDKYIREDYRCQDDDNWTKTCFNLSGSKTDSPSRIQGRLFTCGPRKSFTIW